MRRRYDRDAGANLRANHCGSPPAGRQAGAAASSRCASEGLHASSRLVRLRPSIAQSDPPRMGVVESSMHGLQSIALTFRCMLPAAEGVIVLANTCTCHQTSEERSGGTTDQRPGCSLLLTWVFILAKLPCSRGEHLATMRSGADPTRRCRVPYLGPKCTMTHLTAD